jgi:hypothetical protein
MHTLILRKFEQALTAMSLTAFAATLWGAQMLAAQTPAAPPVHKTTHAHKQASAAHTEKPAAPAAQAAPAPVAPPVPEAPHWPVNDRPVRATVTWNSQGLHIDAANASLQQILKDISTATGATVEGMGSDERVFGAYGPGQARDVLSQLLQGSGYNVLMVGDLGQGAPRQIVLSSRNGSRNGAGTSAGAGKNATSADDEDSDSDAEEPPQPPPPPTQPAGGPQRTPQQIMQEMQQRQQQMQRPNNPQN